jgi:hypothetical protein
MDHRTHLSCCPPPVPLTETFQARVDPHAGVILVPRSLRYGRPGRFADALADLARLHPEGLPPYTVLWLTPALQ